MSEIVSTDTTFLSIVCGAQDPVSRGYGAVRNGNL